MHFARKFRGESWVHERVLLELHSICFSEYTQKLGGSRRDAVGAQQSHSQGQCQYYMLPLQSLTYFEGNDRTGRPIWNNATETLTSWKGCKYDCTIQPNCRKVHNHGNYKTNRTWETFNNQGTKMIILSDELRLTANNSKSFAKRRCIKKYTHIKYISLKTNA